jgi:hypothetical protein
MVPVAVSVPYNADIAVRMDFDNWAFGDFVGVPRN